MGSYGSEKTLLPAMTGKLSGIKAKQQVAERLYKISEPKRQYHLCSESSRTFITGLLQEHKNYSPWVTYSVLLFSQAVYLSEKLSRRE